jgi:hypothetical protein
MYTRKQRIYATYGPACSSAALYAGPIMDYNAKGRIFFGGITHCRGDTPAHGRLREPSIRFPPQKGEGCAIKKPEE